MSIRRLISILLLSFLVFVNLGYCQYGDDKVRKNKIGIRSGQAVFTLKDRVISNFVYNGSSAPFIADYTIYGNENQQKFSLSFVSSDLKNDVYDGFSYTGELSKNRVDTTPLKLATVETVFINTKYSYMSTIHTSNAGKYKFLVGGGFDYYLISKRFRSINFINSISDNITTLSFYGGTKFAPSERHTFEFALSLPLISRVNRILRLAAGDPGLYEFKKWVTINRMFGFNSSLNYNFRFAKRWSLEADYSFLYYQYPFPRKLQFAMHNVTGGLNFHF